MSTPSRQAGFSAVEVLISLFIAVAFVGAGYQLYSVIIKDGAEARWRARASNIAYTSLRQNSSRATNPCTTITPPATLPASANLPGPAAITVSITCPYGFSDPVSKITTTITYGSPEQKVIHALFTSN